MPSFNDDEVDNKDVDASVVVVDAVVANTCFMGVDTSLIPRRAIKPSPLAVSEMAADKVTGVGIKPII